MNHSLTPEDTVGCPWASSIISVEEIDHLVQKSNQGENPWIQPALGQLIDRHFYYISTRLNYYRFLYYLVERLRPPVAVELGVEHGIASAHMAAAAHSYGGKVIGIDINHVLVEEKAIQDAWPGTYTFIHGDTVDAVGLVEAIVKRNGKIGILFQDSSHHYAPSCQEWDYYRPIMQENSIWVCDDITPSFYEEGVDEKSMVAYFDERPARYKLKYPDVLHYGNTVGVLLL